MHDLAPLKLASQSAVDWDNARVPGRMLTGFDALHLKVIPARGRALSITFGFPGPLTASRVGNIEALWIGPGEWLLIASPEHLCDLDKIQGRTNQSGIASVRCGSRLNILDFDAKVRVFAGLTGLPATALEPSRVARTRLADIPVILATGADGATRIIVDRTYAAHLRAFLDHAI